MAGYRLHQGGADAFYEMAMENITTRKPTTPPRWRMEQQKADFETRQASLHVTKLVAWAQTTRHRPATRTGDRHRRTGNVVQPADGPCLRRRHRSHGQPHRA